MPPRLRQIPSTLSPTDIQIKDPTISKRQSSSDATTGIIPTSYPTDGAQPGTVAGITLGVVAGVILLCILFYFLSTGNKGGGGDRGGPSITGTEDIIVRERRRSRSPLRSRSKSPDRIIIERRDRDRRKSNRKSHRSRRSEQEMRQVSRSPGAQSRRPSRTIVEERVERVTRDRSPQRNYRSSNVEIVDERRSSRPPPPPVAPSRRHNGDDIVEVIEEEGSVSEAPRRDRRSRRQSSDYRY